MAATQPVRQEFTRRHVIVAGSALGVAIAGLRFGAARAQATPAALDLSAYPELKITATDAAMTLSTATVPAGYVLITLVNQMSPSSNGGAGSSVVGPPAGMSMAEFMTQAKATPTASGAFLPAVAYQATILGGPGNIDPGQTGQAIVNIPAGDWLVTSPGSQPFGTLSATAGTPGATSEPAAAVTITEIDFGFAGLGAVPAGPQIWKVVHKGTEPHMLVLLSVPDGTTIDELLTAFSAPPNATPAPGGPDLSKVQDMGGVDLQSAGTIVYPVLNLAAGSYAAVCFVPDPNKGYEPHAMEGMTSIFTVGGAMSTPTS